MFYVEQAMMAKTHYDNMIKTKVEYESAKMTYDSFNDTYAAILTNEYITYADGSTHKPLNGFRVA